MLFTGHTAILLLPYIVYDLLWIVVDRKSAAIRVCKVETVCMVSKTLTVKKPYVLYV